MKILSLTGRTVTWSFVGCRSSDRVSKPCSSLHARAREVLRALFPCDQHYEEVPLPNSRLRFDFVIPSRRIVVEVQGSQHTIFNTHHYRAASLSLAREKFRAAQDRDRSKVAFCQQNSLKLITLSYENTDDEWTAQIRAAGQPPC